MSAEKELEMPKKRRSFPPELKKHIVSEIESGQVSLTGAARKYSISATAISRWREQLKDGALDGQPSVREKSLEKEVRELREKVGSLTMEIDLLKKLEAYARRLKSADSSTITGLNWHRFRKDAA
ncbi:MAG: transposase [Elusimicrobia bacterium]|nr:transposase [Elusimicrobiota bacterium]MBI5903661.1 transposase [Deltaproteobacteria bacterium]